MSSNVEARIQVFGREAVFASGAWVCSHIPTEEILNAHLRLAESLGCDQFIPDTAQWAAHLAEKDFGAKVLFTLPVEEAAFPVLQ